MIKHFLFCLFIIALCNPVLGQEYPLEFGKVDATDFDSKQFAAYEDAGAVVIFNVGESRFDRDQRALEVFFERKTRIMILSEAGVDWAQIEIPFFKDRNKEQIYDIKAYSYSYQNGLINKTALPADQIFEEKISETWSTKKFEIPNVQPGTIIEYTYTLQSPFIFNLPEWKFQWRIPVLYSEYIARLIPFYDYAVILQQVDDFDQMESYVIKNQKEFGSTTYHETAHKYVKKNVPPFRGERFMTSSNDYIMKMQFQLAAINDPSRKREEILTTWNKLNRDLLDHDNFGTYIRRARNQAKSLFDVNEVKSKSEKERFDFVMDFVKENYTWNGNNGKYATKSAKEFADEKLGNIADINLFATGLLEAVGLNAKAVILSTRDHGKIKHDYPFSSFFNYVVVMVELGNQLILSDATEIYGSNYSIPPKCINDQGLIVEKDKAEWVELTSTAISQINNTLLLDIADENEMTASVFKVATNYDGLNYKNAFENSPESLKKELETEDFTLDESTLMVKNDKDKEKPYTIRFQQKGTPEMINNKIYIAPFLDMILTENPLKEDERTYPVDIIYPIKRNYNSTVRIPEGFEPDYMPEKLEFKSDLYEFSYQIEQKNDSEINILFSYTFFHAIYPPETYADIKSFFGEIVKKGNEKIVLKKQS